MLNRFAGDASLAPIGLDSSNAGLRVFAFEPFGEAERLLAIRLVGRAPSEFDARDEGVVIDEVL